MYMPQILFYGVWIEYIVLVEDIEYSVGASTFILIRVRDRWPQITWLNFVVHLTLNGVTEH
jgi:hypothetical protein